MTTWLLTLTPELNRGVRPHAEKVHQEKVQQEKLKALKACLNFEETSRHSESRTLNRRRDLKERLGPRHARSMSGSPESRCGRSRSPMIRVGRKNVFKEWRRVYPQARRIGKECSHHSKSSRHQSNHIYT
ncbi:hypothetical protein Tco_0798004 [Tanacetum coccineum]